MTPLRQKMIDAMQQRGFSPRTHESYLYAVRDLAKYSHKPPDQLQTKQIQEYFGYLVQERHLSGASCRLYLNAIRFLYLQVLHWDQFDLPIQYPKKAQKIPELLTRQEVKKVGTRRCWKTEKKKKKFCQKPQETKKKPPPPMMISSHLLHPPPTSPPPSKRRMREEME